MASTSNDWRRHFSTNAADMLQICRWAGNWSNDTFKTALLYCFRCSRGEKVNTRTVENFMAQYVDVQRELGVAD
jgi:hypothetical protein